MTTNKAIGHTIGLALAAGIALTGPALPDPTPPTPAPVTIAEEVTPTPAPCPEATAEDGSCVPFSFYAEPTEDSPEWDCRIHGNHQCGVQLNGVRYILDFDTNTFILG